MRKIIARCCQCKSVVNCLESDMSTNDVMMPDGNSITLTKWTCPLCGFVHTVQIDDSKTKELFNSLRDRLEEITNGGKLKHMSHQEIEQISSLQRSLNNAYCVLNARYNGSVYQYGEQKFKLELCTPDAVISGEEETTNA